MLIRVVVAAVLALIAYAAIGHYYPAANSRLVAGVVFVAWIVLDAATSGPRAPRTNMPGGRSPFRRGDE